MWKIYYIKPPSHFREYLMRILLINQNIQLINCRLQLEIWGPYGEKQKSPWSPPPLVKMSDALGLDSHLSFVWESLKKVASIRLNWRARSCVFQSNLVSKPWCVEDLICSASPLAHHKTQVNGFQMSVGERVRESERKRGRERHFISHGWRVFNPLIRIQTLKTKVSSQPKTRPEWNCLFLFRCPWPISVWAISPRL